MPAPYWTPKPDRHLQAVKETDLVEINTILSQIREKGGLSTLVEDQPEMFGYQDVQDGRF
jgi:hypothetical protein